MEQRSESVAAGTERGGKYAFLAAADFLEARRRGEHHLFRGALPEVPAWDDIFLNLERSIEADSLVKVGPYLSLVTHEGDRYVPQATPFMHEIRKLSPALTGSAHVYIGLTRFSKSFGRHRDNSDVFFWQVIGSTRWKVYAASRVHEYDLAVGDVLYVPRNMDHEVESLTPRVGISFGLDYGSAAP